ncbi:MAG: hypothetical protein K2M94_06790 [Paramuribaculum sp.]|nr:hypothetical protein [Paramuribaculum sp.]
MDQYQIKAMSLYQNGEYKEAIETMASSQTVSDKEYKDFVRNCNRLIIEQYKFMINDAIATGDHNMVRKLITKYRTEYGLNPEIENLDITNQTYSHENTDNNPQDSDGDSSGLISAIITICLVIIFIIGIFAWH